MTNPNKTIESILKSYQNLGSEEKKEVEIALGVDKDLITPSNTQGLVDYNALEKNIESQILSSKFFEKQCASYKIKPLKNDKIKDKLRYLVKVGILDKEQVTDYISTIKRIDRVLDYETDREVITQNRITNGAIGMFVAGNAAVTGYITGDPTLRGDEIFFTYMVTNLGGIIGGIFGTVGSEVPIIRRIKDKALEKISISPEQYHKRIENHLRKHGNSLKEDLEKISQYNKSFNNQIESPRGVIPKYARKILKIKETKNELERLLTDQKLYTNKIQEIGNQNGDNIEFDK